ncbi:MAG: DUF4870 domain-containing protein [Candidatus Cloacimonetes bacterium]|nr:DUF4870 domain-containing protein [Candidatus Cloacimonadota bacterium]
MESGEIIVSISNEEKTFALIAHLGTFIGYFFVIGHVLVPLLVYLLKGNESTFIRHHALEALNFQLSMTILLVISIILIFLVVGIFTTIALGLYSLVVIIIASIKAFNGELYQYPYSIRFVK